MTHKQAKTKAIHQTLLSISEFYKVAPEHLLSEIPRKGQPLKSAREMMVYHLKLQGMTFESISRLLFRSPESIRKAYHEAKIKMQPEEQAFIAALPTIPCAQVLAATKSPVGLER